MRKSLLVAATLATTLTAAPALAGKDLDAVKARGELICGVAANGLAGFMVVNSQGSGPDSTLMSAAPLPPPSSAIRGR